MYNSFNLYKFFLHYFNYRSTEGVFTIEQNKLIYSVKKTIDALDKNDLLDTNCFSWYFANSRDEKHKDVNANVKFILDTYHAFNLIQPIENGRYKYDFRNCYRFDSEINEDLLNYSNFVFEIMKVYSAKYRYLQIQAKIKKLCFKAKSERNDLSKKVNDRIRLCDIKIDNLLNELQQNNDNLTHII